MRNILQHNYNLYIITDQKLAANRSVVQIIKSVILGGVTIIQYREKTADTGVMIKQAQALHEITRKAKIPLIINDRIDVALAIDADGVHVGQKDMPAIKVRKMIGKNMILGVSANTVNEAIQAERDGADYIGAGPVFITLTKPDADPDIGLQGLKEIKEAVSIPVVAIGGINVKNAEDVLKIADGIAVISAVMGAKNPRKVAEELSIIVKRHKGKKIL
jgi:thiamine-phosphate pyrophosphorylase